MRSDITTISSKLEITQVRDVQVTETVDDGQGGFIRSLKIFGESSGASEGALVLEVLLQSEAETDLDIATPILTF